jgi:hypothetical protein
MRFANEPVTVRRALPEQICVALVQALDGSKELVNSRGFAGYSVGGLFELEIRPPKASWAREVQLRPPRQHPDSNGV